MVQRKCLTKGLLLTLLIFLLLVLCIWIFRHYSSEGSTGGAGGTFSLTEDQIADTQVLRNVVGMNKPNAEIIQKEVAHRIVSNAPDSLYIERNVSPDTLVSNIEEKVRTNDLRLPKEAREKTDKTLIIEQPSNPDVPVGIYKINVYRNWEIGTGIGMEDGGAYIPLSIQRNYSHSHSVAFEAHYSIKKQKISGGEIQWKVHF